MVLDTSAVVAVLRSERGWEILVDQIEQGAVRRLSAASLVEAALVMQARYGDAGERELDVLLNRLRVEIIPVTEEQADIARTAYRRFGKGRHPAGLNFGDCFSYALAVSLGEPLLYVGSDFDLTDVATVE